MINLSYVALRLDGHPPTTNLTPTEAAEEQKVARVDGHFL
jgi:hypothetical protein